MKTCSKCKNDKPTSEFNKNSNRYDGLVAYCRMCEKEYQKMWYIKHNVAHKARSKKSRDIRKQICRKFIVEYLKTHPCVDCNESDIIVLDFDHVRGKKKKDVSLLINSSLRILKAEIKKCEIRCANCHRRRTAKQFGSYKLTI